MSILGIIAEYDPFHNGHLYHLAEAKKRVQPDFTYIVLSPCLKQRGTFSMLSPLDRARLALEGGANAVFALLFPFFPDSERPIWLSAWKQTTLSCSGARPICLNLLQLLLKAY